MPGVLAWQDAQLYVCRELGYARQAIQAIDVQVKDLATSLQNSAADSVVITQTVVDAIVKNCTWYVNSIAQAMAKVATTLESNGYSTLMSDLVSKISSLPLVTPAGINVPSLAFGTALVNYRESWTRLDKCAEWG